MARLHQTNANKALSVRPGTPTKPANLSPRASAAWDRLLGELQEANLLITVAHRAALSMAATIAADIQEAWAAVQKDGAYLENAKTGGLQAHPASKRIDALRRDYIKVLTVLGLRAALSDGPQTEQTLDDVLNG